ncbi:hypothetical protein GCM10007978_17030 [Shewanella hanedai]|nr:hypothetical protein GCM10007978_17030 [Shewanella hanedai]
MGHSNDNVRFCYLTTSDATTTMISNTNLKWDYQIKAIHHGVHTEVRNKGKPLQKDRAAI